MAREDQTTIGGHVIDRATKLQVDAHRKAERERLYALRRGMPQSNRAAETEQVIAALTDRLGDVAGKTIAFYWPIRGELDLRACMHALHRSGATVSLPVVVTRAAPVEFRTWAPGCAMTRGIWNIPVPAEGAPQRPDIVILPLVGIDADCYRLGNGGGYYDMTLASLPVAPLKIGVGQGFCRIDSIRPQPWDVRLDTAILGDGSIISAP
ncbi:5-formyltetrahydrofolate cyclo-ligase [Algicella marina]|uniref:5-formyltetrahydrofolate cyclo-ligase n=1 Tax=Algicella marina TaxID=2683284 RepID=A0A6P1T7B4_9RHOB|nr:5-formyltetrahydrofolate cyclo-ligase [Algicella marina]QHQ37179.1 5-formyltetrahydrofolate cyclo-ligase [Algicella marina]